MLNDEVVYIPLEKLKQKGVDPKHVRCYLVNGGCLTSGEARYKRDIKNGDYIAVERHDLGGRRPQAGDTVLAYWEAEDKMVVKVYKIEREGIVLMPTNPAHPNIVLPHEQELMILGRVVLRLG